MDNNREYVHISINLLEEFSLITSYNKNNIQQITKKIAVRKKDK